MNYLKNLKWEMILFSILSITMGVLMVLFPAKILTVICILLASILFILGIGHLLEYRRRNSLEDFYKYELVIGAICIAGGIAVLVCMNMILSIITYGVAVLIIISGLMKVENALDLRKMQCHWVPLLVFAIICVLLGIWILMMPMNHNDNGSFTAGDFMVQCAGVILIISGVIDLITTLAVSGKIKSWIFSRNAYAAEADINNSAAEEDYAKDNYSASSEDEIVEDGETGKILK